MTAARLPRHGVALTHSWAKKNPGLSDDRPGACPFTHSC
jgi:hypothetical protein